MVDLDKISLDDEIFLFRPQKKSYLKGKVTKIFRAPITRKRLTHFVVEYKKGVKTKHLSIKRLLPVEIFAFKNDSKAFIGGEKFGRNPYTFRTKMEMLIFLDLYSRDLCNEDLKDEIEALKRNQSSLFI